MNYDDRTEQLLAMLPTLTEREFAALSLACADQAGISADSQRISAPYLALGTLASTGPRTAIATQLVTAETVTDEQVIEYGLRARSRIADAINARARPKGGR